MAIKYIVISNSLVLSGYNYCNSFCLVSQNEFRNGLQTVSIALLPKRLNVNSLISAFNKGLYLLLMTKSHWLRTAIVRWELLKGPYTVIVAEEPRARTLCVTRPALKTTGYLFKWNIAKSCDASPKLETQLSPSTLIWPRVSKLIIKILSLRHLSCNMSEHVVMWPCLKVDWTLHEFRTA